jgi:hypothetical protein
VVAGVALGPAWVVTLSDDTLAASLISAGLAVAVTDATTAATMFATDRWIVTKFGSGAI